MQVPEEHTSDLLSCIELIKDRSPLYFDWDTSLYSSSSNCSSSSSSSSSSYSCGSGNSSSSNSGSCSNSCDDGVPAYQRIEGAFQARAHTHHATTMNTYSHEYPIIWYFEIAGRRNVQ